jgi:hypothetical protein
MTEGQWIWMMVHMSIDNEEQLEKVCGTCQEKAQEHRCMSCNELLDKEVNPNFDEELFNKLKANAT